MKMTSTIYELVYERMDKESPTKVGFKLNLNGSIWVRFFFFYIINTVNNIHLILFIILFYQQ